MNFVTEAKEMQEMLRTIRRDIHRNPELSMQEYRTSEQVKAFLRENGIEMLPLDLPTSVVAVVRGRRPGKTVALRTDMDALPIQEETDRAYRSQNDGVMHACGHDVHLACLMGAAKMLMERRKELCGTVLLLFQASEENLMGARQIMETGVLDQGVDALFALHTNTGIDAGKVAFLPGPSQASADLFAITVEGRGGHGAFPNTTIDPILIAAQLITQLQTIVSRNMDPIQTGVVSVCQINGGTSNNIIPEKVELKGTYRAMDPAVRSLIRERIRSICEGVEKGYHCRCVLELPEGCPPIVNEPALTEIARRACVDALGKECVVPLAPAMVGDDMAFFLEQVPGVLGALGVRNEREGIVHGNHTPRFAVDEECLWVGAACMAQMAWTYLNERTEN